MVTSYGGDSRQFKKMDDSEYTTVFIMKAFFFFFNFKVGECAKEVVGEKSPSVWTSERRINLFHLE